MSSLASPIITARRSKEERNSEALTTAGAAVRARRQRAEPVAPRVDPQDRIAATPRIEPLAREIEPAVAEARGLGIDARGPYPADSIFSRAIAGEFDVAMSGVTVRPDRLVRGPMTAPVARADAGRMAAARAGGLLQFRWCQRSSEVSGEGG